MRSDRGRQLCWQFRQSAALWRNRPPERGSLRFEQDGPWDYKQIDPAYENFGNFHFGVVAAVFGWRNEPISWRAVLGVNAEFVLKTMDICDFREECPPVPRPRDPGGCILRLRHSLVAG